VEEADRRVFAAEAAQRSVEAEAAQRVRAAEAEAAAAKEAEGKLAAMRTTLQATNEKLEEEQAATKALRAQLEAARAEAAAVAQKRAGDAAAAADQQHTAAAQATTAAAPTARIVSTRRRRMAAKQRFDAVRGLAKDALDLAAAAVAGIGAATSTLELQTAELADMKRRLAEAEAGATAASAAAVSEEPAKTKRSVGDAFTSFFRRSSSRKSSGANIPTPDADVGASLRTTKSSRRSGAGGVKGCGSSRSTKEAPEESRSGGGGGVEAAALLAAAAAKVQPLARPERVLDDIEAAWARSKAERSERAAATEQPRPVQRGAAKAPAWRGLLLGCCASMEGAVVEGFSSEQRSFVLHCWCSVV